MEDCLSDPAVVGNLHQLPGGYKDLWAGDVLTVFHWDNHSENELLEDCWYSPEDEISWQQGRAWGPQRQDVSHGSVVAGCLAYSFDNTMDFSSS